jgi:hypothetical protein
MAHMLQAHSQNAIKYKWKTFKAHRENEYAWNLSQWGPWCKTIGHDALFVLEYAMLCLDFTVMPVWLMLTDDWSLGLLLDAQGNMPDT